MINAEKTKFYGIKPNMSKEDKDWTFVYNDGSVQLETQLFGKNTRESDSDQDFEVLKKPNEKQRAESSIKKYKGIFIKEDHFGDAFKDDGSDIEVVKKTPKAKEDHFSSSDNDDKDSIEILDSGYHNDKAPNWSLLECEIMDNANGSDSDYEKVPLINEVLTDESTIGLEDIAGLFPEEAFENDLEHFDDEFDNDEFDGLVRLFETSDSAKATEGEQDVEKMFEQFKLLFKDPNNASLYGNDSHVTNDGIVLSTSMFIILLCLSLSAGLIIGKGLTFLSQSYNMKQAVTQAMPSKDAVPHQGTIQNESVPMNVTSHQAMLKTLLKSEEAGNDAMDIRLAYQEMQLKYHKLQRKYNFLGQQYHIQKQILLFSKKMKNLNEIKMNSENDPLSSENRSNIEKELLWWKMRTSIWRRKYLDLKVQFLETKKNLTSETQSDVSFKACTGLITKYLPELNVTALLKSETSSRIASGAKMCWRKVFSPVKVVRDHMGSSLSGFSNRMDGLWKKMKTRWDKRAKTEKHESDDTQMKASCKWRRFRKMFSMSNIVGSLKWKMQQNTAPVQDDDAKEYCELKPLATEFKERWSHDSKVTEEEVSYLPPQLTKGLMMSSAAAVRDRPEPAEETGTNDVEMLGPNVKVVKEEDFEPCTMFDGEKSSVKSLTSSKLKEKEAKLKARYESFENRVRSQSNRRREKEERLKRKLKDFDDYQFELRDDIRKKREMLEKKMRSQSNRRRNKERVLKRREKKLEIMMKRMEDKFEKVFEEKSKEVDIKKKNMERELKIMRKKNEKERSNFEKEKTKFRRKVEKLKKKLKANENELVRRRAEFEKWNEDRKKRIIWENVANSNRRYNEERKLKKEKDRVVRKMTAKMKQKEEKLEKKTKAINNKIEQLRSAMRRLLKEENLRMEEIEKKNEEVRIKQSQVDIIKLFYADVLKQEKENHAKAKEMVWQMKKRVIKLKEAHQDILHKYKIVQQKLAKEREKLRAEKSGKIVIQKPVIYCPDQQSCQGEIKIKGYGYTKEVHDENKSFPSVFCPHKDSCKGNAELQKQFDEFETLFRKKTWQWDVTQSEAKVLKKHTAVRPVPPDPQRVANVNPFFFDLHNQGNETATKKVPEPQSDKPKPKERQQTRDSSWYFSLMEERAKQRAVPWSWYLYWSQGRKGWRNAIGKNENDNWYLKFMRERERQRNAPVGWYFKRGKGKEEDLLHEKSSWLLNRGKGREEARKKEGFYYCW